MTAVILIGLLLFGAVLVLSALIYNAENKTPGIIFHAGKNVWKSELTVTTFSTSLLRRAKTKILSLM